MPLFVSLDETNTSLKIEVDRTDTDLVENDGNYIKVLSKAINTSYESISSNALCNGYNSSISLDCT